MKEFSGYFDYYEDDPREYGADEFAELSRVAGETGVSAGLKVAPAGGMAASISAGRAMIDGYIYALINDGGGAKTFTLGVAGSADRIDRIILRLDLSSDARNIQLAVLEGTPGPSPAAPALTRNDLIKEISLCRVRVPAASNSLVAGNFTDERLDESVCGPLISEQLSAMLATKLDATTGNALSAAIAAKASTARYSATLTSGGWSSSVPYTQTVTVTGILATDDPFADVNMSGAGTGAAGTALGEAWGAVGRIETKAGSITAYCYEKKPTINIPILLKVVR